MSESIENITSEQTNFTFYRQPSKDNPENMFESVVDTPHQSNQKQESSINPITLQSLYQDKKKNEAERNKLDNTHEDDQYLYTSPIRKERDYMAASDEEEYNEIHEFHSYMDLTAKLENALNKISSSKRSANATSRSSNIITRFGELQQKKKEQMRKLKQQRALETERQIKSKPTISKTSQKIAQEVGHEPIHLRYQKIMQAKKKQFQLNQEIKQKQQMDKQAQFLEEFQKHCKKPDNIRSYQSYYNEMVKWKERRTQQNRQKFEKKRNQEIQGLTFQPTISNKSKKLMAGQKRLPISQRGLVRQKIKPLYTFTPNINQKQSK